MKTEENILLKEGLPDILDYYKLFETTGWNQSYKATAQKLYEAISNSWYTVCAYQDKDLIGFGRVISDGILYAFICDMIIVPLFQTRGAGSMLLKQIIAKCKNENIRVVWLFSADGKMDFYKKHGFEERPSGSPGMQLKNVF